MAKANHIICSTSQPAACALLTSTVHYQWMTIDERLERLAQRHEALTQTVELMVHHQREWHENLQEWQTKADERQRKNEVLMAQVLESIDTLARIAHLHERRISDLEERPGPGRG